MIAQKAGKRIPSFTISPSYSQFLVARFPMYSDRQVSRLIDVCDPKIACASVPFPDCSSGYERILSKYGDEIVRDSHPLPFSPADTSADTFRFLQLMS